MTAGGRGWELPPAGAGPARCMDEAGPREPVGLHAGGFDFCVC